MPHRPKVIPDQAGPGSLRRTRTVEVRFRDASAHQTCLCKQTRDGVTPEEDITFAFQCRYFSLECSHNSGRMRMQSDPSIDIASTTRMSKTVFFYRHSSAKEQHCYQDHTHQCTYLSAVGRQSRVTHGP